MRPMRYFKMHTLPLPGYLDEYAATNLGLEMAVEIGWRRTPTGSIGQTAATVHLQIAEAQATHLGTVSTHAMTAGGHLYAALSFADYSFRSRVQTSEGFGEWGEWVTVPNPSIA